MSRNRNSRSGAAANVNMEELATALANCSSKITLDTIAKQSYISSLKLSRYDGSYDITLWLEEIDRFLDATKSKDPAYIKNIVISHLDGPAKFAFDIFKPEEKDSYNYLRQALKERFTPSRHQKLQKKAALYQLKQKAHQTVAAFVLLVQAEARGLGLSEEDLVFVIIQGLQPKIRNYIKMSDPSSVRELLECPAARDDFEPGAEHTGVFQALVDQVAALQATIEQQSTTSVAVATAPEASQPQPQAPPAMWQPPMPYPPPSPRHWHVPQQLYYQPPPCQWRPPYTPSFQFQRNGPCGRCGRACQGGQQCPALGKRCHQCGKMSHFSSVCRSAPPQ